MNLSVEWVQNLVKKLDNFTYYLIQKLKLDKRAPKMTSNKLVAGRVRSLEHFILRASHATLGWY